MHTQHRERESKKSCMSNHTITLLKLFLSLPLLFLYFYGLSLFLSWQDSRSLETNIWTFLWDYLDRVKWAEKPKCRQHHSLSCNSSLHKEKEANWAPALMDICILTLQCGQAPMSSCQGSCYFSIRGCFPWCYKPNQTILSFITIMRQVTNTSTK